MRISRKYLIVNALLIALTAAFAVFVLLFEYSDPKFPAWITALGLLVFALALFSFIKNFKKLEIGETKLRLKRLFRSDLVLEFSEIVSIEETSFRYRGEMSSHTVYKGHFLIIRTKGMKVRTSSLNEPDYLKIREQLKESLGTKVQLEERFQADRIDWLSLAIITVPTFYLVSEIIKKLT